MFDLPPGHDAPPAVVIEHDEATVAQEPDALTRSVREQIAAAYSAGALTDAQVPSRRTAGGPTIVPPPDRLSASGDPTIVPPKDK